MKKLRRVTEAEVIAEFLKSEFYHREFHRDRDRYEQLVMECDITDEAQNALRRALLFRRRGHMWRELPADTQWWEMEVEAEDIPRIRVFPRAQWRKLASGSFLLTDIVKRMRSLQETGKANPFIAKIQSLSYRLRRDPHRSSVLLIGLDTSSPVTILEGNHRLTAALLASPATLQQSFRIFCGLSERMNECCWYRTTLKNLWRYARNRLRYLGYRPEPEIVRMPAPERVVATAAPFREAIAAGEVVQEK